jgi:hypothetical protein
VASRIVFAPLFSFLIWQRSFGDCMKDLPAPEDFLELAVDILANGLVASQDIHR